MLFQLIKEMGTYYEFQKTSANSCAAAASSSSLLMKLKELKPTWESIPGLESVWAICDLLLCRKPCLICSESVSQLELFKREMIANTTVWLHDLERRSTANSNDRRGFVCHSVKCSALTAQCSQTEKPCARQGFDLLPPYPYLLSEEQNRYMYQQL